MKKHTVAVFFGGRSPEYTVSLQSAYSVLTNLSPQQYQVVPVGITRRGQWFLYNGPFDWLLDDSWHSDTASLTPAMISPDPEVHGLLVLSPEGTRTIPLDCALPVLHGKNGEDGTVQGLLELADIPIAGCGTLASALCMDKDRAHKLAAMAGVLVPRSLVLSAWDDRTRAAAWADKAGFPLFVKPVKAGSSYGITKVSDPQGLPDAIAHAFAYDDQVVLEEAIDGFEVGCAVMGTQELIVGEIDEIELSSGFFDFTEKYTLKTSAIHVPARVDEGTARTVKETAQTIYRALGCAGFARVDLFLTREGELYFNEVNTIPGFTEHSRFPGMMKAAGYTFPQILDTIIRQAMDQ
ncbi:MAG: D-alanine--D-serine ligase VanG [Evtepia sp.]|uniref:D-alanine--D-serine ligase VanG n=1 Tax=Evtepia sp. TaxID=2773933 RepID=UPI002A74A440|nr:D-alanine--D-serine ligase VanG [Evtepia sp.]MDY3014748.1 D-alanine--D-serine ligase VanG [Evtepia sp.]